ncbi:hypothetical protein PROFUN_09719 [Planoprotostelium fungivorum]|uniref:Uncharacterized protein n=1 Tax=Planoprotostelium fungivorum TaxID=1890364 RepID=A0A2P6NEW9_9EUKA|nr:hypothetical protein PROFUN_09719 [Planoprotostelium fungivorum]
MAEAEKEQVMSGNSGHNLSNGTRTTDNKYVADNGCWKATGPGYSVSYNYLGDRPNGSTPFASLCLLYDLSVYISTQTAQSEYRARERLQMFCRGLPNRTQEVSIQCEDLQ